MATKSLSSKAYSTFTTLNTSGKKADRKSGGCRRWRSLGMRFISGLFPRRRSINERPAWQSAIVQRFRTTLLLCTRIERQEQRAINYFKPTIRRAVLGGRERASESSLHATASQNFSIEWSIRRVAQAPRRRIACSRHIQFHQPDMPVLIEEEELDCSSSQYADRCLSSEWEYHKDQL